MRKKILSILSLISLSIILLLSACNKEDNPSTSSKKDDGISTSEHVHTYAFTYSYDEAGHWYKSTCGHDLKKDYAKHTYSNWTITKEATETSNGEKMRTCSVCGYSQSETIDKLEHVHTYSTEFEYNESKHWRTSTCGHNVTADESVHDFTDWVVVKYPTTSSEGIKSRACKVCNYSETSTISKLESHTIIWKNYDGTILETDTLVEVNTTPTYDGETPSKPSDETYTYTFAGWTPTVSKVSEDTVYTATYTSNYIDYTITFVNDDNKVLSTNTYHYGDTVVEPTTPTKESDNEYNYTFLSWDKEISTVTGNTTYKACYTKTNVKYSVVFKNYDGTIISTCEYNYGEEVTKPQDPTRDSDNTYTYTFAGWNPEVNNVTSNITYTATYTATFIEYTVKFVNYDNTILLTKTYHYGDSIVTPTTPTKPSDETYTYTFAGWTPTVSKVSEDCVYTATYTSNYIDYTITFVNDDNKVLSTKTYHYGDTVVEPTTPTKESDNEYNYTFLSWDKEISTVTGNATYKACYSKTVREYTITYNTNGGSEIASETLPYNTLITAKPTLEEKSFKGWFDESLTVEYITVPSSNITLYAKWVDYEVTLSYNLLTQIKETDTINASLFNASAIDTDGNNVDIAVKVTGTQSAGEEISVRLTATGLYEIYDTYTIKNIKVYGNPTITYDSTKDYINLSDTINANLFNATALDSFNESLNVNVSVKENNYSASDLVTIVISSTDCVNNITTYEISNVKIYGSPVITRDTTITSMKLSDTVSNDLFNVTAKDSFNQTLTVTTAIYSGSQKSGNTITIKSSATDSKGNTNSITYMIKVYGLPTISDATVKTFKVNDEITLETLGIKAYDSFNQTLTNVTLTKQSGEQASGQTLTYLVTATDSLGNVNTKKISDIKIYGEPTITYDITIDKIKFSDTINASLFNAKAIDTFGNTLTVNVSLNSGTFVGGNTVTYKFSAVDSLGNKREVITNSIKVYSSDDIVLTYTKAASKIKASSKGEEFNATATNSFKDVIDTKIVAESGYSIKGGNTINLYIVATDALGNTTRSELISNIKVYENIHISYEYTTNFIHSTDDVESLFTITDDFNKSLLPDFEIVSGSLSSNTINYKLTVKDSAGNSIVKNYTFDVLSANESILYLYEEDSLISTKRVNLNDSYSLDQLHNINTVWYLNDTKITDSKGVSLTNWNMISGVYNVYAYFDYSITVTYLNTYNNESISNTNTNTKCSYNKEFSLTYTPETGYKLVGWYVGDTQVSDENTYTFNLTSNSIEIICKYSPNTYTVTIDATGYTYLGKTSYTVTYGESYTFDVITELGSKQFKGWQYNNKQVTDSTGYIKVWNIDSNVTLTPLLLYTYIDSTKTSLYFGSYPQSKVSDSTTISSLNTKAGTLPTSSNTYKWSDYGYYISGSVSSYMYYIDIDLDNDGTNDYRGVYFTSYRPYYTGNSSSSSDTYQSTNGYSINTIYWFKYEPIKWNILSTSNNQALIISDLILDSQDYNYTTSSRSSAKDYQGNSTTSTVYSNNYMYSHIRSWLNTTFYETAFDSLESEIIETTSVDNSASSTNSSSNPYACQNTSDKIFLLSYKEVTTYYSSSSGRIAQGSDYAKSQGLFVSTSSGYVGNSYYWLRSPSSSCSNFAHCVNYYGDIGCDDVSSPNDGVRAACKINL